MTYTEEELNDAVKGCFGVDSRSSLVGLRGGYYVVAEEQYDTSYVYRKLKTIKS